MPEIEFRIKFLPKKFQEKILHENVSVTISKTKN